MKVECPVWQRTINKMVKRANMMMERFGTTLEESKDSTPIKLLREAQEEALDIAVYLEALIDKLELSEKYQEWKDRNNDAPPQP
ncbi:hypothetical protein LCGC14_0338130 [marine sediment metagenome]|uniref:Uncharacterized protein n=1 Tax=marine sediment metagenome TaxID=412755 RepID=A0A0F9TJZ1_9ZZZZ